MSDYNPQHPPPKRYLLFAGDEYERIGGWLNLKDDFGLFQDAESAFNSGTEDWAHIVDCVTGRILLSRSLYEESKRLTQPKPTVGYGISDKCRLCQAGVRHDSNQHEREVAITERESQQ